MKRCVEECVRNLVILICEFELSRYVVQVLFFFLGQGSALADRFWQLGAKTNMLELQLLLQCNLSLMESAEFVDLVLILSPDLHLVAAGRSLVFL